MPLAVLVTVGFGLLIGLPALRLRADYFAIATIALAEVVRIFAQNARSLTDGNQGLSCSEDDPSLCYFSQWRDVSDSINEFVADNIWSDPESTFPLFLVIWVVVILATFGLTYVTNSPWGRVLRAIREDEDAARALGKNTLSYKLQSLAVSAVARRARRLLLRAQRRGALSAGVRAARHVLRLQRPHPRRARQLQGRRVRGDPVLVRARGHAVHRPAGSAVHGDTDGRAAAVRSPGPC